MPNNMLISMRLPKNLKTLIDRRAKSNVRSRGDEIRRLLWTGLSNQSYKDEIESLKVELAMLKRNPSFDPLATYPRVAPLIASP